VLLGKASPKTGEAFIFSAGSRTNVFVPKSSLAFKRKMGNGRNAGTAVSRLLWREDKSNQADRVYRYLFGKHKTLVSPALDLAITIPH